MKGAPVLHWPKLFEGQVGWQKTSYGGGYITGQIIVKGNGTGDGYGNGKGGFNGGRNDTMGGGAYAYSDGNGWSMRSV